MTSTNTVKLCVLHARCDASFLRALLVQLSSFLSSEDLTVWHRDLIRPGQNSASVMQAQLESASIIAILLSAEFLAVHKSELATALQAERSGTILVPILCRPVVLERTALAGLDILPRGAAVSRRRNQDEVWTDIARRMVALIDSITHTRICNAELATGAPDPAPCSVPPRVLFLGANPLDSKPLDLGREVKEISRGLEASPGNRIEFVQEFAVTLAELSQLLLRHRPSIVHFSCHGSRTSGLVFEDRQGNGLPAPIAALARLFATINETAEIRCVVLSACCVEEQARLLAAHVDFVIGIGADLSDVTAAAFASGFYSALAAGRSVQSAFELGRVQIELLSAQPADLRLLIRPGLAPNRMRLFSSLQAPPRTLDGL